MFRLSYALWPGTEYMQDEQLQEEVHDDALPDGVVRNAQTQVFISYGQIDVRIYVKVDGTILREENGNIPVVSNVGRAEDERGAPEDRVSGEFVPASDAVAVAAHNFAHNQVEQVRRTPDKAHDSTVLT